MHGAEIITGHGKLFTYVGIMNIYNQLILLVLKRVAPFAFVSQQVSTAQLQRRREHESQ